MCLWRSWHQINCLLSFYASKGLSSSAFGREFVLQTMITRNICGTSTWVSEHCWVKICIHQEFQKAILITNNILFPESVLVAYLLASCSAIRKIDHIYLFYYLWSDLLLCSSFSQEPSSDVNIAFSAHARQLMPSLITSSIYQPCHILGSQVF